MTKEHPILFSGAMVRAILDGRKTQTRRIIKPQPDHPGFASLHRRMLATDDEGEDLYLHSATLARAIRSPYGKPGDRLWVRETWGYNPDFPGMPSRACYRADPGHEHDDIRWKPSIHMPRTACRLVLEITGVRVERLNDCSEEDALAEGVFKPGPSGSLPIGPCGERVSDGNEIVYCQRGMATAEYRELWDQINGAGAWAANPWVWVVEFRRI